jgi:ribosomal protein S18 acetylase RimI-like enzyme
MSMVIRRYQDQDEVAVLNVWFRSGKTTYTFLPTWQAFTYEEAKTVFRDRIVAKCEVWVGECDDVIVAYLAMDGSYIDRLYVAPAEQRNGWGKRLIEQAKLLSPGGLQLHTHQENHGARAFYETHGFEVVRLGISPPPESAPDVEYHWSLPATS